jgi:Predicted membrane protein (DUF2207)
MTGDADVSELLLILFLAAPIVVAVYMFWLAWTRGGDSEQDSVRVQYEPPDNLTPGECGALVDNAVALRSITATITDLSVKGYLSIEQKEMGEHKEIGRTPDDHTDYIFHLTKPLTELDNLKPHEREVITGIFMPANPLLLLSLAMGALKNARKTPAAQMLISTFSSLETKAKEVSDRYRATAEETDAIPDSVAMSDLQQGRFALRLQMIRDALFDGLVAGGYYVNRPDRMRMLYAAKGVLLGLLLASAGLFLAAAAHIAPVVLILTGLFTGAIVIGFGRFVPARTSRGARTMAKVLGFREFLSRVEKDHIERLEKTPELFKKYLPYAMALAVETKWTQAFAKLTLAPPQWHRGNRRDGFLPMHLTSDLNQMSVRAANTSSPI